MKKNRMMRLASGLLVAVLATTSMISGTYAKYVTSDSVSDKARVAKFGVVVTADGTLFGKTYLNEEKGNKPGDGAELTVVTNNDDNVVAPGTNNAEQTFKFSIKGTPEVDVKIDVVVTDESGNNPTDIFLAQKNDLPDMTTGDAEDQFDNTAEYHPIKYTLKRAGAVVAGAENVTLETLESELEKLSNTKVEANTVLDNTYGDFEISWKWDFDDNSNGTYDKQDTLLGDLAAEIALTPETTLTAGTDYNLNTSIKIAVTVTQVD